MSIGVYMPKLGLTMAEGTIVRWLKQVGEQVSVGEPILEITTDKIENVIEAQDSGVLESVLFQEGDVVPIGTVVAYLTTAATGQNEQIKRCNSLCENKDAITSTDKDRKIKQVIPLVGVRKVIAERMQESMQKSPQATASSRADVTALVALRESYAKQGIKYSVTDLFVKLVAVTLEENPILNASLQDQQLIMYESINIGVAVAAESSLVVPVVKNVQEKDLVQISSEVSRLVKKAREGKLESSDMTGGTFTISNLGMFNVDVLTPIVNPPEAAILALGPIHKAVVVDSNDEIKIIQEATLSLTFDHAVTDGVPAARFLETLNKLLASPAEYLL